VTFVFFVVKFPGADRSRHISVRRTSTRGKWAVIVTSAGLLFAGMAPADEAEHPRDIVYAKTAPVPAQQSRAEAEAKSAGCLSCHTRTDQPSMHANPAVVLGCVDCHGGDAKVVVAPGSERASADYQAALAKAHVLPRYPQAWRWPSSALPERSYTLLNREAPEFIRFTNPGDLRVAREACGACHLPVVEAVERSLMSTAAMFWGGASYNNGILPFKRYILGEAYTRDGKAAQIHGPPGDDGREARRRGRLQSLLPLPAWETIAPADNFRVFERGGRNIKSTFPEIGLPNRLEEPGKPDIRQSNRGPGTGSRISVPVLNITKTRLNDPNLWFLGTADQPGDFRSSGCSACHVPYANDRDPLHAGPLARFGHKGATASVDPTIPRNEAGHPIFHAFTRAIPTSQCMICHMHQPNMFVNTYLGYTMWDYESDAPSMWPAQERHPSTEEAHAIHERNPEGAAVRGLWGDIKFLEQVSELNPGLRDTQFADYHGHGWNFRAIFKRARDGTLLDARNQAVADDDPQKFRKAVHLRDIHAEKGMQCADCHFSQDAHGDGHMHAEVAAAVEVQCADCHGTIDARATLRTSGPAAAAGGRDLTLLRNADGRRRFEWIDGVLYQRSIMDSQREWRVTQVKDSVTPGHPTFNERAARAKTMRKRDAGDGDLSWGPVPARADRAHDDQRMACFTCHTSWTTSCGGCHLPIEANEKTERHHYEGGTTRNFATYNPQVARDDMFLLGRHGEVRDGIIAPIRSSSALVLSSTDINRNHIYVQQPPISAAGYSAQAFAPHFPHTVRQTETKGCDDCHLSKQGDNNAILAQLLGLGTSFVNFVGFNAYVGTGDSVEAIQVTEWDEPQAVIGSYLHRYAYPERYQRHLARQRRLEGGEETGISRYAHEAGEVRCLQLRGEYLYAAQGAHGMQAFDVASVANKGFSERILTAPFSPLGQGTRVRTRNATCVALPTTQPIRPERNTRPDDPAYESLMRDDNLEQRMHPVYRYAAITDAEEGLILSDVTTLADFEPRNNFLGRDVVWNPDGLLDGARYASFAGHILYVAADRGIVVVDLDDPRQPRHLATIPLAGARAMMVQFRYLFAVDAEGLKVIDVTQPQQPRLVEGAALAIADARSVFVSRTYAYIAAGKQGLVIVDVERPEQPRRFATYNADGAIVDAHDVMVASTNASLFAYVADGAGGLKVVQLTSPESQPKFYGFSPQPRPQLIATSATTGPAWSLSRPLERDRAVDETGEQIAVFGRIGARPFTLDEMRRLYLDREGKPWFVDSQQVRGGAE